MVFRAKDSELRMKIGARRFSLLVSSRRTTRRATDAPS